MRRYSTRFLLARREDPHARKLLLDRYRPLAVWATEERYAPGLQRQDLVAAAMIGVDQAISSYDPARPASFGTHAQTCAKRRVLDAITAAHRHKHEPLNTAESTDKPLFDSDDPVTLADLVPTSATDPLRIILARERLDQLDDRIDTQFTPLERDCVQSVSWDEMDYETTGRMLGVNPKAVDNAVQRARRKLSDLVAA